MLSQLDSAIAALIAMRFFEQYNSDVIVKDTILDGDIWTVIVSVGLIDKYDKNVRIDARTGKILEYR